MYFNRCNVNVIKMHATLTIDTISIIPLTSCQLICNLLEAISCWNSSLLLRIKAGQAACLQSILCGNLLKSLLLLNVRFSSLSYTFFNILFGVQCLKSFLLFRGTTLHYLWAQSTSRLWGRIRERTPVQCLLLAFLWVLS